MTDSEKDHRALTGAQRSKLLVLLVAKKHQSREPVLSVRNVEDNEGKSCLLVVSL